MSGHESDFPKGLSAPARRALASAGIARLADLARFKETEIMKLHGFGPSGMAQLKSAMAAKNVTFAPKA